MQTIWFSPTEFVTGDNTLKITYPQGPNSDTVITCPSTGNKKWISMALRLPQEVSIEQLFICYKVANKNSYISHTLLQESKEPGQSTNLYHDPTDLKATASSIHQSDVGGVVPSSAVTLFLRLEFQNANDKIMLGAVGVKTKTIEGGFCGINVKDFGAIGDGKSPHDRAAIQDAIDDLGSHGGTIYFPPGIYQLDQIIEFDSNIIFQGANVGQSVIEGKMLEAVFRKRGLPSDLSRAFHVYFRDLMITNGSRDVGIGIDFTNVSQAGINTVRIEYVQTGICVQGNGAEKGALYVDLYSPLISTTTIALQCQGVNDGVANETHIFGGRIGDVMTGIELNNINNFQVYGTAIEGFTTGVDVQGLVTGAKIFGCRFESNSGDDPATDIPDAKGIRIDQQAIDTLIIGPYFSGRINSIENNSNSIKIFP